MNLLCHKNILKLFVTDKARTFVLLHPNWQLLLNWVNLFCFTSDFSFCLFVFRGRPGAVRANDGQAGPRQLRQSGGRCLRPPDVHHGEDQHLHQVRGQRVNRQQSHELSCDVCAEKQKAQGWYQPPAGFRFHHHPPQYYLSWDRDTSWTLSLNTWRSCQIWSLF